MIQYRYDQLQFSTEIPNFINIGVVNLNLNVSGTIANGSGQNFTVSGNISDFSTFNDFKCNNVTLGQTTYLTNNNAVGTIWEYAGSPGNTETVTNLLTIIGTLVTFEISVDNFTGSNLTLIPQSFVVEAIEYQLPF